MSEPRAQLRARVRELLAHDKPLVGAIVVYAVAAGLVSLAVPLAAQSLVSSVAATGLLQPVFVLTVALFVALLAGGAFAAAELSLTELAVVRFFRQAAKRFAATEAPTQEQMLKFYDTVVVQKSLATLLSEGPALALQAALGLLLLTVYHPLLLFFALGLVACIIAVIRLFAVRGEDTSVAVSFEKHATAWAIANLADPNRQELIGEMVDRYERARRDFFGLIRKQTLASHFVAAAASAAFLALGAALVIEGQLSLGQLVAADIVVALVAQSLMKVPKLMEKYYELAAALSKIDHAAARVDVPLANPPRPLRIVARLVAALLVLTLLALVLVPWRQTAFSQGRVIAYAPADRQQAVEAPIEGRILKWHVQEGQAVKQGDDLVDITDNDPEILSRLRNERDSVERRMDATRRRTLAIEERIASLTMSKQNAVSAATSRVAMARQRLVSAERMLDAAKATVTTTQVNIDRQKRLLADGLASMRTVELAELDHQRAIAEVERAVANLASSKDEIDAINGDRMRVETDATAQLGDARASLGAAEAELASAGAELARMDVRLSRQSTQAVKAPRDGVVLRVIANAPGGSMVKSGDVLATLVPATQDRAVELYVSGIDAPLVQPEQSVRLQFEGWPAVQFSGWPSVAVGTFAGKVSLVDSASDERGQLRALIVPDTEKWPDPRFLRQGVRAQGWVLLSQVSLGFELWRRLNGFAPALPEAPKDKNK